MWYWSDGMHWWGWLLGALMMGAFWVLLVWGIWYLISGTGRDWERTPDSRTPRQILDERLARGEITPEAYRHTLDVMNERDRRVTNGHQPVGGPAAGS